MDILGQLTCAGLVPVIKIDSADDAVPLCAALSDGGLPVAEITFRTAAAEQAIKNVSAALPDVILGAGTVLSVDQVERAVQAGAKYIVSPGLNPKVVGYCVERGIPVLPGCQSPSDIEAALEFGLDTVKFFPAEAAGGIKYIKAVSAPYGGMRFVPTGGINEQNALDYLNFPKVRAVGGSWMAPPDAVKAGDFDKIRALTKQAVSKVLGMSLKHIGINSQTPERALDDAKAFCLLCGLDVKDGSSSVFAGDEFEFMKNPFRGEHGHIAIGVNDIPRAKWHLEKRGFEFDSESERVKDGKTVAIYLKREIAGFAVHLLAK